MSERETPASRRDARCDAEAPGFGAGPGELPRRASRWTPRPLRVPLAVGHAAAMVVLASLVAAAGSSPAHAQEGRKRALVIAIGDYGTPPPHPTTGEPLRPYRPLNAGNDVPLVTGALQMQGFAPADIRILKDAEADADGIRQAFRRLTREVDAGDVVVVHYSGHGHRIANDNPGADEEVDGYDELLVPYGAHEDFYEGYDGSRHIRDDEVGELLQALRERAGPRGNVTFFIDACYSGTATRGDEDLPARGVPEPLGPPAFGPGAHADLREAPGTGLELPAPASTRGRDAELAPYAVFSAASQRQVAYETFDVDGKTRVGSLSYALARTLPESGPGTTYRALMAQVAAALSGKVRQTPQVEGTLDARVFSDRLVVQSPFVVVDSVISVAGEAPQRVVLSGGTLLGLNPGTRLVVHPVGTARPDPATALAAVTVENASPVAAVARVTDGTLDPSHGGAWAFTVARSYGDLATRVRLDPALRERDRQGLTARLGEMGIVELVQDGAEVVILPGDGVIQARTVQDDLLLARGAVDVIRVVEEYARNRYLRRLDFRAPELSVALDFTPSAVVQDMLGRVTGCADPVWESAKSGPSHLGGDQWRMTLGDVYRLRVRNTGDRRAFVTLLDLMPRGAVRVLRPREGESPSSYELEPGAVLDLGCYQISDETGHETLKLFATSAPQDFRAMFETRGSRGPGASELSPLEALLAASYGASRSEGIGAPQGVATTVAVQLHVSR